MKTLIPFEPFRLANELSSIGRSGDLFDLIFSNPTEERELSTSDWKPSIDVKEDDSSYLVAIDIPGIDPKNVELTIDEGVLTVKGERLTVAETEQEEHSSYTYHKRETYSGKFVRSLKLPTEVDAEAVEARAEHGVLEVRIPKKAAKEARKIEIN